MAKIFISYRRDDTGFGADRVHEAALDYVSDPADVFMDIDGIPPGADFVKFIEQRVAQCDVLFALIGREWLDIRDPDTGKRRLDDPEDFVRPERTRRPFALPPCSGLQPIGNPDQHRKLASLNARSSRESLNSSLSARRFTMAAL